MKLAPASGIATPVTLSARSRLCGDVCTHAWDCDVSTLHRWGVRRYGEAHNVGLRHLEVIVRLEPRIDGVRAHAWDCDLTEPAVVGLVGVEARARMRDCDALRSRIIESRRLKLAPEIGIAISGSRSEVF